MRKIQFVLALLGTLIVSQALKPTDVQAAPGVTALTCTPPATDPEIANLARALNYNFQNIYEYVYYNIDHTPTFGSKKGALGTYLDRSGNNFDQNVLFVTLLRQSCITANYRYATIGFPSTMVANLLGVSNDAGLLVGALGNAGIPACVQLTSGGACVTSGTPTNVNMNVVWTEATANGTTYELDPSLKSYQQYTPISLATAMGYSQSTFLSQALSGSSAVSGLPAGITSLKNVNRANLVTQLNTYSQNLTNYIKTNYPTSSTQQIFGGRSITNANFGVSYAAVGTLYSTLPTTFETAYTVSVSNNADGSSPCLSTTLYGSQITGRALTLSYSGTTPSLVLEGQTLASCAATTATTQTVTLKVSNPYAAGINFATTSVTASVAVGGAYGVILAPGDVGRDTLTRHQTRVAQMLQPGQSQTTMTAEGLAAIGSAYLSQSARAAQMVGQISKVTIVRHEAMGIAGYKTSPYVDFPGQLDSGYPQVTTVGLANEVGAAMAMSFYNSSLESTAVTQMQNNPAVSTVKMFDYANSDGTGILQANLANWNSVKGVLTGWSASELTNIGNYLAGNSIRQVFLPQNGARAVNTWTGSGYYQLELSPTSLGGAYKISGGYKGGWGTISASFSGPLIASQYGYGYTFSSYYPAATSQEPINLYSGAYTYDHDDISVGSVKTFPFGLTLKSHYDSSSRATNSALGWGWLHNFMISARTESDSFGSFGDYNRLAAVQTAVNAYVAIDLSTTTASSPPIGNMVTASLASSWLMDQLVNNAVTVTLPDGSAKKFIKVPTSAGGVSYVPPPGDASVLTVNSNGTYKLTDKSQTVMNFDAAGNITSWVDANSNTVAFTYSGSGTSELLTSVSNGMGRTLTFTYNASNQLTTVSNGSQSVSYGHDANGNLTTYTDATSQQTKFAYQSGAPGFLTQIFYPNYPSTAFMTNVYDAFGKVRTQADALGNVWTYMFANGFRSQEVDPLGGSHVLYYDSRGNQTSDINQVNDKTVMAYDGAGRLSQKTDPTGSSTVYAYDANSNVLTKTTNPVPGAIDLLTGTTATAHIERWTYNTTFNKVQTSTDANGYVTTNAYDSHGNLTSVTQPAVTRSGVSTNPVSTFVYNTRGLVTSTTDAEGMVTANTYDPTTFNLLTVTRDSGRLNLKTTNAYDAVGNKTSVTNPNGNVTTTTYDAMRRPTMVTGPASTGVQTQTVYDGLGNPTQVKQWNGTTWLTTTTAYDARGKATSVTTPDGKVRTKAYDAVQRVATETSSSGRQVLYTYDLASRVTQITDQVSGTLDPSITVNRGAVIRQKTTYAVGGLQSSLADGVSGGRFPDKFGGVVFLVLTFSIDLSTSQGRA